jgi:hypothetical protein
MPDAPRSRRFAVLIDADNTSPRIAAGLFEEIARFGDATVRRIRRLVRHTNAFELEQGEGRFVSHPLPDGTTIHTDSQMGSRSSRPPRRRGR